MGIQRQAQIAQRTIFSLNGFDDLLVKIASGFFAVERQTITNIDALTGARNQVSLFVVHACVQNTATLRQLCEHRLNTLFIRRFGTHQRGDVQRDLTGQRAGQLFELRITLLLVALTKPGSPLHQRDEQRKAGQYNHCTMKSEF